MHIILIKTEGNRITRFKYMDSKWERNLGETMNIEGVKMQVGIIADSRDSAIKSANELISKQNKITSQKNKITRQKQRSEENKFWSEIINESPVIKDCIETIAKYKNC